jgi:hypothetical protein
MSVNFTYEGDDRVNRLKNRVQALSNSDDSSVKAMSSDEDETVRVWYGDNLPPQTHAWLINADGQVVDGKSVLDQQNLVFFAALDVASGVFEQMNVVFERGQNPVFFPSESEMESYFAERLLALQELP